MNTQEMIFTSQAVQAFRDIIGNTQEVSLIAAEKLRAKIFHKLHLIQHHPIQGSKAINIGVDGNFRLTTALNVKIYYKVEENRTVILDLLIDKENKTV
jgi:plasmid stabilization system protein ParE